jgi:hypothetical protein
MSVARSGLKSCRTGVIRHPFVVNNSLDEPLAHKVNLREAITTANLPETVDRTITFDQTIHGSTTYLKDVLPQLTQNITIDGLNSDISIYRNEMLHDFRLMEVNAGVTARIKGLKFGYGEAPAGESGGAIRSWGTLELYSTTFQSNSASFAGGAGGLGGAVHIPAGGNLSVVSNSLFDSNNAYQGGAISIVAPSNATYISFSTFQGNSAVYRGGAIQVLGLSGNPKLITVTATLITDNMAVNRGAGIYVDNADLLLDGYTDIQYNFVTGASGEGGGVYINGNGSITYSDIYIRFNDASTCLAPRQ